jgi:hypothetical protein
LRLSTLKPNLDKGFGDFQATVIQCFVGLTGQLQDTDMATFIKNTDKFGKASWQVKIRRKGFPSQTRTFAAKAQAQEWARSIETAMDRAEHPTTREAEQTTLGQILARYRDEVVPTPRGSKYEVQRISQLLRHPLAQSTMADLTPSKIACAPCLPVASCVR